MSDALDISKVVIGDVLYRFVEMGGIFRYVVNGIRQYEDERQFEVECQSCAHGWKCRLLVAPNDWGRLVHVRMLNEDDEDCRNQRHWHTNDGYHFWPTHDAAQREAHAKAIQTAKESVRKAEADLEAKRKRLAELEALLGGAPA